MADPLCDLWPKKNIKEWGESSIENRLLPFHLVVNIKLYFLIRG